jgi:hypothetical protein
MLHTLCGIVKALQEQCQAREVQFVAAAGVAESQYRYRPAILFWENQNRNQGTYRWQPHCRGLYQTPIAA